jgi:hypothetical protein
MVATVEPKARATNASASIEELKGIREATITEAGPMNTRRQVPNISERHSFLQLEQGSEETFTRPHCSFLRMSCFHNNSRSNQSNIQIPFFHPQYTQTRRLLLTTFALVSAIDFPD